MAKNKSLSRPEAEQHDEGSRTQLLAAARSAFAERGLEGARVDDIARRAGINKQLVYHYFGSKNALYSAVLKEIYREIRDQEAQLKIESMPAEEAMRILIGFSFDYLHQNPDFVRLLSDENTHKGTLGSDVSELQKTNRPIIVLIEDTIRRGISDGVFRKGLDPLHVYLSIAGMTFFYFSNIYTLSRAFSRPLDTPAALAERRAHIVDFALNAIRSRGPAS